MIDLTGDVTEQEETLFTSRKKKADSKRKAKSSAQEEDANRKARLDRANKRATDALSPNAYSATIKSSRDNVKRFLNKFTNLKSIKHQISVLTKAIDTYKKSSLPNKKELVEQTKEMLANLRGEERKYNKILGDRTKEEIQEFTERRKKSTVLADLEQKRKVLAEDKKLLNPSSIVKHLKDIESFGSTRDNAIDLTDDFEDDIDLEDYADDEEIDLAEEPTNLEDVEASADDSVMDGINKTKKKKVAKPTVASKKLSDMTKSELYDHISNLTGYTVYQLQEMSMNQIRNLLKEGIDEELVQKVDMELEVVNKSYTIETAKISNSLDMAALVVENLEINDENEAYIKNIMVSAYTNKVKNIAVNICMKSNKMQYINDAVSIAFVTLTQTVNRWYDIQKKSEVPISFETLYYRAVSNTVRRELYSYSTGGMYSGSTAATNKSLYNKEYALLKASYLQENPEDEDLPEEVLEAMIVAANPNLRKMLNTVSTASDYEAVVAGAGEESADVWANAMSDSGMRADIVIGELDEIKRGLIFLFNQFEVTNKNASKSSKPFDRVDKLIFMLRMGFITEKDENGNVIKTYKTQEDIAEYINEWRKLNGISQTIGQSALSTRIKKFNEICAQFIEKYPELAKAFASLETMGSADSTVADAISSDEDFVKEFVGDTTLEAAQQQHKERIAKQELQRANARKAAEESANRLNKLLGR